MAALSTIYNGGVDVGASNLLFLGISGPARKSTLSRILSLVYPQTVIIEADDFSEVDLAKIPALPEPLSCPDADSAHAVDYESIIRILDQIRSTGNPYIQYNRRRLYQESAKTFNERLESSVRRLNGREQIDQLRSELEKSVTSTDCGSRTNKLFQITLVILEGFLLYQNDEILKRLDVKLLLRMSKSACKTQRLGKWGQDSLTSRYWATESYFEASTWRNYVKEHEWMFVSKNVEREPLPHIEQEFGIRMTPELDMDLFDMLLWAVQQLGPAIRERLSKTSAP